MIILSNLSFPGLHVKLLCLDSTRDTYGKMRKSRSVLTVSPNNVSRHVPKISQKVRDSLHITRTPGIYQAAYDSLCHCRVHLPCEE